MIFLSSWFSRGASYMYVRSGVTGLEHVSSTTSSIVALHWVIDFFLSDRTKHSKRFRLSYSFRFIYNGHKTRKGISRVAHAHPTDSTPHSTLQAGTLRGPGCHGNGCQWSVRTWPMIHLTARRRIAKLCTSVAARGGGRCARQAGKVCRINKDWSAGKLELQQLRGLIRLYEVLY